MPVPLRQCPTCGKSFQVVCRASPKKFCSHPCAVKKTNVPDRRGTLEQRFWAKVYKSDSCWLWIAGINTSGYGILGVRRADGLMRMQLAHRISWTIHFGDIPEGMCVLHDCPDGDNPLCVNPAHLWLGTDGDNAKDKAAKGRSIKGRKFPNAKRCKGESVHSAKLTEDDVRLMRKLKKIGASADYLSKRFKVHKVQVWAICRYAKWKHVE